MHLYFITRGIKHDSDRFIQELSAKYVPFKYDGKDCMVQVAVRPIQLYECVFPKEHLNTIMNTLTNGNPENTHLGTQHKQHKKWVYAIRKILGIKPIPKIEPAGVLPLYNQNIEIIGIGIKEDRDLVHESGSLS